MSRVKELLSELRDVTERSRPNTMANDQINLIEAIEYELNKSDIPALSPVENDDKKENAPVDETISYGTKEDLSALHGENESVITEAPKRGRKAKQD